MGQIYGDRMIFHELLNGIEKKVQQYTFGVKYSPGLKKLIFIQLNISWFINSLLKGMISNLKIF